MKCLSQSYFSVAVNSISFNLKLFFVLDAFLYTSGTSLPRVWWCIRWRESPGILLALLIQTFPTNSYATTCAESEGTRMFRTLKCQPIVHCKSCGTWEYVLDEWRSRSYDKANGAHYHLIWGAQNASNLGPGSHPKVRLGTAPQVVW